MPSRLQKITLWVTVLGVFTLAGLGVWRIIQYEMQPRQLISVGKVVFQAEIADTEQAREKGLSGRDSLPANKALLLKFDSDDKWGIWMKGMKMPIDIVWINSDKQVVHVEHDVQPDAEPYVTYLPPSPARYVLEINSGEAKKAKITVGSTVKFDVAEEGV